MAVSVHTAQKEPVLENDSKVEKEKVAVVDKRKAEGNEDPGMICWPRSSGSG